MSTPEYVWLTEERIIATMVSLGAYVSTVAYTQGGIEYEVLIENDEFELIEGEHSDGSED